MFKMRKPIVWIAVILLLLMSFTACAKKSESPAPTQMADSYGNTSAEQSRDSVGAKSGAAEEQTNRKIIKNADVQLRVKNITEATAQVEKLTKDLGGYVKGSSISDSSGYLTLMVPSGDLDAFLADMGTIGKVLRSNTSTDDVTDKYFDTEIRIKNLEVEIDIMRKLLQREGWKVSEILEIEREIRRLTDELELLKGQITNWDRRVQFSQVDISFHLENTNIIVEDKETFGYNIKVAFKQGVEALTNIVTFIVSTIVYLLPLAPIIALGYLIWRFILKPIIKKIIKP